MCGVDCPAEELAAPDMEERWFKPIADKLQLATATVTFSYCTPPISR